MEDLVKKIRLIWDECKGDSELQERLNSETFFRQEQQDLMKSWMKCSIPEEKLKKLAKVKGPAKYKDDEFDQVCASVNLTTEEKAQLQTIVENFAKRNNQVISLNNYSKKIPLAYSLSNFKTESATGDASKRTFSYFLNPQTQFPAKEEKLKEVCEKLGIESTDEALLEFMESLKLEGSRCKNQANQTSLYWEILWETFYVKTIWLVGASWDVDGKSRSFIGPMYNEGYWEGGADSKSRTFKSQLNSLQSIRKGDIIAIKTQKNGLTDLDIRCVGIVDNDAKESSEGSNWFSCPVSWMKDFDGITFKGMYHSYSGTIKKCGDKLMIRALSKIIEGAELKAGKEEDDMQKYVKLLENNHNIILHGAPGTGKTYLAKQIARKLIFPNKNINEALSTEEEKTFIEQYGFVQFHQSYDYADLVEGLRPVQKDGSSEIGFKRKDGEFKKFCKKAIGAHFANFDSAYSDFIGKLKNDLKNEFSLQTLAQKKVFKVRVNGKDNLYATPTTVSATDMPITKENLRIYVETGEIKDWKPYVTAIGEYLKDHYSLGELKNDESLKNKKFVFIIDEINRGEMSKIFGELFFSIDPGYRGEKGRINTQYQNLIDEDDVFANGFYVPENVYIIGTMNDIDRSVESMDFAMRRRFAFEEITAEQSVSMFDNPESWKDENDEIVKIPEDVLAHLKNRMRNLNTAILEPKLNLGQAYQIGGAYFLKFAKYYKDGEEKAFANLWNYHLKGLLTEYLRGMPKAAEHLAKLKECYDTSIASESSGSSDNASDSVENS